MPYACDNPECRHHVAIPAFLKDAPSVRLDVSDRSQGDGWSLSRSSPRYVQVQRHQYFDLKSAEPHYLCTDCAMARAKTALGGAQ